MTGDGVFERPRTGLQATIIGTAIKYRGVIVALALVLLGYGTLSVMRAKYDVFPEFAPPQVGIQTEAPGLTAEQVEILVTQPIENAINGVPACNRCAPPRSRASRSSPSSSAPTPTSIATARWWVSAWRKPRGSSRPTLPRRP